MKHWFGAEHNRPSSLTLPAKSVLVVPQWFLDRIGFPCPPSSHNNIKQYQLINGAPEGIRTPDPQIRSLVLYPAELPAPDSLEESGAPGEIRTPDPQIRSLVLYPAELRALIPLPGNWATEPGIAIALGFH